VISPTFYGDFMTYFCITAISLRKNTDQGDFVLKTSVHTVFLVMQLYILEGGQTRPV